MRTRRFWTVWAVFTELTCVTTPATTRSRRSATLPGRRYTSSTQKRDDARASKVDARATRGWCECRESTKPRAVPRHSACQRLGSVSCSHLEEQGCEYLNMVFVKLEQAELERRKPHGRSRERSFRHTARYSQTEPEFPSKSNPRRSRAGGARGADARNSGGHERSPHGRVALVVSFGGPCNVLAMCMWRGLGVRAAAVRLRGAFALLAAFCLHKTTRGRAFRGKRIINVDLKLAQPMRPACAQAGGSC